MPRPAKTLEQLVLDRTFKSRRHHELLAGPVVEWPTLALIQARYVATSHLLERRLIGLEFEHTVRALDLDQNDRAARERAEEELRELLDQVDDVDLDGLGALLDRSMAATWCRDLRRAGTSFRAIGEQVGMSGPKVRREILWLERELARPRATRNRRSAAAGRSVRARPSQPRTHRSRRGSGGLRAAPR